MSLTAVETVAKQLKELEEKAERFNSLGEEEEGLKKKLSGLKPKMVSLKKEYDTLAGEFGELILEAVDIYNEREKLADNLKDPRPREWIVTEGYAYHGNFHVDGKDRVIHESMCPGRTGAELFELIRARRLKGKK